MRDKMTLAEFAMKSENEGGLFDAVTSYGLDETDLRRLEDPYLYDLIQEFAKRARELEPLMQEINDSLEEYVEEYLEE